MGDNFRKYSVVIFIASMIMLGSFPSVHAEAVAEVKILFFIDDGFGESYYINKALLESYNYTIVTASSHYNVSGCANKGVNGTMADVLIYDLSDENLTDYYCLLIPSGGHWSNVMGYYQSMNLLRSAHGQGILLAGICTV